MWNRSRARHTPFVRALPLILATVTGSPEVAAQSDSPSGERIGSWPAEFLERPIELRPGVGEIHDPVSTASAEAQAYYDQGLGYYYLYTYHDAARSFHQALRLDPDLAMAHLGLHLAYTRLGGNERARAALAQAAALAQGASESERVRIELRQEALDARHGDHGPEAYRRALHAAVQRFPHHPELVMLRARNLRDHSARIDGYHEVLTLAPRHVGAIHELVHSHEHEGDFEAAAEWGGKLAELAFGVPHGLHMAGHNFPRVGRIDDAIRAFEAADRLERQNMEESGLPPAPFTHFRHNLEYLALARWHQGDLEEAERLLHEMSASVADPDRGDRSARLLLIELNLVRGEAEQALLSARRLADDVGGMTAAYASGLAASALVALGRPDEARLALKAMGSAQNEPFLERRMRRVEAELLLLEDDGRKGAEGLRTLAAEAVEHAAHTGWFTPTMEVAGMAAVAAAAGNGALAHELHQTLLEHDPRYIGVGTDSYTRDVATPHRFAPRPGDPRRVLRATRVDDEPPAIDGRLDDPAWGRAQVAAGFTQHRPVAGAPASEGTEVRILYDDEALYVGVRLFDAHPDSIVARLARRNETVYSDWFFVAIDSYHDRRTAFAFGVNPRGVQRDFMIHDDNRTDPGWNAVWESAAAVDQDGWTAEFRIPFSQLRFSNRDGALGLQDTGEAEGLVWGVNFERHIARSDEVSFWAPVPGDAAGRVSLFGELRGLAELPAPRRLELRPYTLARATRAPVAAGNPLEDRNGLLGSAGLDLQYGVSSDLTLTMTLNPDFGQVEADPSELNLTAYETFLQERRPFFLEGAEIFDTGWPALFYSRRIGRRPQGRLPAEAVHADVPESTTILGAAKLTGKSDGGWSLGFLDAVTAPERARYVDTEGEAGRAIVEPLTNYAVARVRRDLRGGESTIGAIGTATHRALDPGAGTGSPAGAQDVLHRHAFTAGVDARHRFGDGRFEAEGSILGSRVTGSAAAIALTQRAPGRYFHRPGAPHLDFDPTRTSLSGLGALASVAKVSGGHWRWRLAAESFSPGFEVNDLGFFPWPDETRQSASVGYDQFRPGRIFRNWRLDVGQSLSWTLGGERTDAMAGLFANYTLLNHWGGYLHYERAMETTSVDALRGGPAILRPGRHVGALSLHTDRRRAVHSTASVNWRLEDGTGGRQLSASLRTDARPSTRLEVSLTPRVTATRDPWQYVTARPVADSTYYVAAELRRLTAAATARLDLTFTPTLSFQLYAQPFVSAGRYSGFAAVANPLASRFEDRFEAFQEDRIHPDPEGGRYEVTPDGTGSSAFAFPDPDFNFKQFRSSAVLRWEYRPGSTFFLAWGADRTAFDTDGTFRLRRDLDDLFRAPGSNALLMKLNYWIGR